MRTHAHCRLVTPSVWAAELPWAPARVLPLVVFLAACTPAQTLQVGGGRATTSPATITTTGSAPQPAEVVASTARGNTFIVPTGWALTRSGEIALLEPPERGSWVAVVDVQAPDAAAAVTAAWAQVQPGMGRALKVRTPVAPRNGWSRRASFEYLSSPNEHREVQAIAQYSASNGVWNVVIEDVATDLRQKRGSQFSALYARLLPQGHRRENFGGRKARVLDAARVAELTGFVESALQEAHVPGAALGLIQDGKVVFAGGFGVRDMRRPDKVNADTSFLIASITKPLTTLMLAKLVDDKRLDWETPAAALLPKFKLGDADTTAQARVKNLICACTGLPRRDYEWLFEFGNATADSALASLSTMQPTTGFGELYQYSNPMAAAAGYVGGHVANPGMELGSAYDKAMRDLVYQPLGMLRTTHDFDAAERGPNTTVPHGLDIDGRVQLVDPGSNRAVIHVRPAAGAWSTVNDLLKFVAMELAEGALPDGRRYIGREALLARRAPQVKTSADASYGMGLVVDRELGTPVVSHGGDMRGFHSLALWLPEHGVGAVLLTNWQPGWHLSSAFQRKLLEVLFGARPEAGEAFTARTQAYSTWLQSERQRLDWPVGAAMAQSLAARYHHPAIGEVRVRRTAQGVQLDFGEWASEVAHLRNPDGTDSLITVSATTRLRYDFLVGRRADGTRTLLLRDAQHRYELLEQE